jgi:DNA-binding transcriptional LysR family regulator
MEISVLQEFVMLVENCNFQETAAEMNISQSSLTKHIHKLEEELNVSLFDRTTRAVRLNESSRTYYPYAKRIVEEHEESLRALSDLETKEKNEFTIAYQPILGQYGLVDTIADFTLMHPEITLRTIESGYPLELLRNRKCDFAFVSESDISDENFNKMIYRSDHLAVVVPEDHPLANETAVNLEQIANERFILHSSNQERTHEETEKFLKLCQEHSITPNVVSESLFTATMVRYVSTGRGIAVLNRLHVPTEITNVRIIDISPTIRSFIYMVYRRKLKTESATKFLHYMVETVNS